MNFKIEEVPIIIPCSHRPEFLIECLKALNECDMIENSHVWFCYDDTNYDEEGSVKEDYHKVWDYIAYWNSAKKIDYYCTSDVWNPSLNSIGAIGEVAKRDDFDAFIYIEEDVVVSRCFLKFCLDALNFYHNNQNVLMVAGHNENPSDKKIPGEAELSERVTCSVTLGVCGWLHKWKWINKNLANYCADPSWVTPELKNTVFPEINCHVNPDGTMRNKAGGGLVTAQMLIQGQLCLVPDIALANHIGWHGWHIPKETASPENTTAFSNTFHIDNTYSKDFPEIRQWEVLESFGFE